MRSCLFFEISGIHHLARISNDNCFLFALSLSQSVCHSVQFDLPLICYFYSNLFVCLPEIHMKNRGCWHRETVDEWLWMTTPTTTTTSNYFLRTTCSHKLITKYSVREVSFHPPFDLQMIRSNSYDEIHVESALRCSNPIHSNVISHPDVNVSKTRWKKSGKKKKLKKNKNGYNT